MHVSSFVSSVPTYTHYTRGPFVRGQMDFSHYTDEPVQLAEELVNTRHLVSGTDVLVSVEDLTAFLDRYAAPWAATLPPADTAALDQVRALRERLRAVFEAPDTASAASLLNDILQENEARPRLSAHGGEPHLHFEPAHADLGRWLAVVAAMGLVTVLVDQGLERLGTCRADTCEDVYVDTSRNRSRRHCSTTCSTREAVAAHRRRQRSEGDASSPSR